MPVDKARVAKNFGRHINSYDEYARVQKTMAHKLLDRVCQSTANHPERIVEIGCGTGYFTRLLVKAFPQSEITAIDISHQALEVARQKLLDCKGLRFRVADGEFLDESNCDLVVSNATFQWFNDLPSAFVRYYDSLLTEGRLHFATLGDGTFAELYSAINKTLDGKAHSIGAGYERHFPSKDKIELSMSIARFSQVRVEVQKVTEMYDSVEDFLYAVKTCFHYLPGILLISIYDDRHIGPHHLSCFFKSLQGPKTT